MLLEVVLVSLVVSLMVKLLFLVAQVVIEVIRGFLGSSRLLWRLRTERVHGTAATHVLHFIP